MRLTRPSTTAVLVTLFVGGLPTWLIAREVFYDPVVWTHDLASPDGAWIATATTRQWGGFGSAWVETTVSLRTTGSKFIVDKNKPFDVFSLPDGHIYKAYTLSDKNWDTDLRVRWVSPKKLEIVAHFLLNLTLW